MPVPQPFRATLAALTAIVALAFAATSARAHELGALKATLTPTPDEIAVELCIYPDHLPPSLRPADSAAGSASLHPLINRLLGECAIYMDSTRTPLELRDPLSPSTGSLDASGARTITIACRAALPPGSRSFQWTCDLPIGQYMLVVNPSPAIRSVQGDSEEPRTRWLEGKQLSEPFPIEPAAAPAPKSGVFVTYLKLGFTHILPEGLDHILFILGLFLMSLRVRPILAQVTAFTVAHSVTLGLSMFGVLSLPPSVVEPLIALSIAYIAVENVFVRKFKPQRTAVVFAFGLLHGMGFAGALTELGLPRSQFLPALISFNVGVELGQLTVLAAAFVLVGAWFGRRSWYRSGITIPASVAIACVGLYWTVERAFLA